MRALSPAVITALNSRELAIAQLIYLGFPGSAITLNSSNRDIDYGGFTYRGAAGLGTISRIDDSPGEIKGLQFEMSGVSSEALALALSDATVVQRAPVVILLAILDSNWQVIDAPVDWTGRLDTMGIQEDGETCAISCTAESTAVDLLRGNSLTTSNSDQQFLFPGDRAFEYIVSQADVPIVWPTKQYYIDSR